jgi:amino acid transporter
VYRTTQVVNNLASRSLKRWLIGAPLRTEQAIHERLTKVKALAVFSSDALSSVAYATEAILLVLVHAGSRGMAQLLPISAGIGLLLLILTISYRQTIFAYPNGGGAYIVSKENLGTYAGLVAGAALLLDYILTVAVSIAESVSATVSAFPSLGEHRVMMAILLIALITVANLRGIKESGSIFAAPTYVFIGSMLLMIGTGLFRVLTGQAVPHEVAHPIPQATESLTLLLWLRAFASGCTALTGVEAISNGVPAFHKPESKNAAITLSWMAGVLATLFLGIGFLAEVYDIVPVHGETVVSQIARNVFGGGPFYYLIQFATALILMLAANTSYADFPRLASLMAQDGFLPRYLANKGDRLVFSNGIVILGVLASLLIIVFGGETHRLLPLYAVGVFLSFTLSQSGMVVHWWKERSRGWQRNAAVNALGAATTFVVLLVIASTKFTHGAWVVVLLLPVLVMAFRAIHNHYVALGRQLRISTECQPPQPKKVKHTVIVPVSGVNNAVANTLEYARSFTDNIIAVHVAIDPEAGQKVKRKWDEWNCGIPLVVIDSPYRELTRPLIEFIEQVDREDPNDIVTVLVPEFITHRWWHYLLHQQTGMILREALIHRKRWIVTGVPYHLDP